MEFVEGDWNEFEFRRATLADEDEIAAIVTDSYFPDEPLTIAMGWSQEYDDDFRKLWKTFLSDDLSFIAIHKETNKIAGVRIIFDHRKDINWDNFNLTSHQTNVILKLLAAIEVQCNVHEKYNVDTYADLLLTTVARDFRKRGLVTEMYRRSILLARARGYAIAKACFSSPFSRKGAENAGFIETARVFPGQMKNEDGEKLIPKGDDLIVTQACYVL